MQLNARSFDFTSLHQQGLPILPTRNYVTDQPLNVAKQKRECPGWGTPTFIYVLHYVILQYLIHRSTFWPLASDALWSNQVITTQFSHESCFARNSMVVLLLLWLFFWGGGWCLCFVLFCLVFCWKHRFTTAGSVTLQEPSYFYFSLAKGRWLPANWLQWAQHGGSSSSLPGGQCLHSWQFLAIDLGPYWRYGILIPCVLMAH